jgi:beta-galactosidase
MRGSSFYSYSSFYLKTGCVYRRLFATFKAFALFCLRKKWKFQYFCMLMITVSVQPCSGQTSISNSNAEVSKADSFYSSRPWLDTDGNLINAHGGGVIFSKGRYYWFGEKRAKSASQGVNVYSSNDLYNWRYEALALSPVADSSSDIAWGSVMERPKVLFDAHSGKFVMWFHLELKGKGYSAARAGVAVSENVTGPFRFVHSFRPNGNMSRDMTLFQDIDGKSYLIYSSRDNYDLRIVELSQDLLLPTSNDKLLFSNHREAPALFRYKDKYYMITSGCTGWKPNKASIHESLSPWGPWQESIYNPMVGPNEETTFNAQSTFVLPVQGKKDTFIFLADQWNPQNLKESQYLWLPIRFRETFPVVVWTEKWSLNFFKE